MNIYIGTHAYIPVCSIRYFPGKGLFTSPRSMLPIPTSKGISLLIKYFIYVFSLLLLNYN